MIRRLALTDWRGYHDLDIELTSGTTFVVAPNGIGKTSLVEAASWALFGQAGAVPNGSVRAGAANATATIELELTDGRILSIERTMQKKVGRTAPPPKVRLDGAAVQPETLVTLLQTAYSADPAFLARLTMPLGRADALSTSTLGLHDHLSRYFGAQGLQAAVERLDALLRENEKKIRAVKQASPVSPANLSAMRKKVDEANTAMGQAVDAHEASSRKLAEIQAHEQEVAQVEQWRSQDALRREALAGVSAKISTELGQSLLTESAAQALLERDMTLQEELDQVRVQLGVNAARTAAIASNRDRLDTAHEDCPVCRRPLDEQTIRLAHEANESDLRSLENEAERLHQAEADLRARQTRLRALRIELEQIPQPIAQPESSSHAGRVFESADEIQQSLRTQFDAMVNARASQKVANDELERALADERSGEELRRLFAADATLRAARDAAGSTLSDLLDKTIRPLAHEVDARWGHLFPERGGLTTYADGQITREVNGEALPYDSFSTGERMGALILLRLLVLETATNADFCWFDEPLEHLDPDARRHVGSLLARASTAGPLKQLVVTTYEERLARKLEERDPDNVQLLYVRQRVATSA